MSFASAHNDYLDPDRYFRSQELEAVGEMVAALEEALKAYPDQGRNRECWPLLSFGWKDADLDPEGCTGIRSVLRADDGRATLTISGHKTLCDPTHECEWDLSKEDEEAWSAVAHEIVCGQAVGEGEWTGSDWSLHWSGEIAVEWPEGEIGEEWKKTAVERVVEAAREALEPFRKDMKELSRQMDLLHEEMEKKYGR